MRKIRMKASALEDGDIQFISMVERPANRTPFRKMKAEGSDNSKESKTMIHLKQVFSKAEEPKAPAIAAVVVRDAAAAGMIESLKADGFNTEDMTSAEGLTTFKQEDYDEDKAVVVKMSDDVALVMTNVEKMFTSYPDSKNFDDNLKAAGFYPSVGIATDTLVDTIKGIMYEGTSPKDVAKKMDTAIQAYSEYVMSLTSALPVVAFKFEQPVAEPTSEAAKEDAADAGEAVKDEAEGESKEAEKDDATAESDQVADATKGDMEDEPADASKSETETTAKSDDGEAAEAEKADDAEPVAGMKAVLDMLTALKADVSDKFSALTDSVNAVKSSNEENANRIEQVEATAKSAEEAVKGTVLAGDTTVASESLGNMGRNMRSQEKSDDVWGGTNLDKLTG